MTFLDASGKDKYKCRNGGYDAEFNNTQSFLCHISEFILQTENTNGDLKEISFIFH